MAEKQYVIFKLEDEKYGVDISGVSSIAERMEITPIPDSPATIAGMINLRGEIIPVVDLKKRFNIKINSEESASKNGRILIYNTSTRDIGFIVDDASQVLHFNEDDIESSEAILSGESKKFIAGIGKNDNDIYILLDFDKILSEEELGSIKNI